MKKWISLSILVLFLLLVTACGNDEPTNSASKDTDKTVTEEPANTSEEPKESEDTEEATKTVATSGEEVFKQSCVTCHSSGDITGGQSKLDAARIQGKFTEKAKLLEFVSSNMPKNAPGSLSPEEYESVVNYLFEQQK